ncbi:MAG: hypothetical protein V4623_02735 [Pseudomonadota bacterium]
MVSSVSSISSPPNPFSQRSNGPNPLPLTESEKRTTLANLIPTPTLESFLQPLHCQEEERGLTITLGTKEERSLFTSRELLYELLLRTGIDHIASTQTANCLVDQLKLDETFPELPSIEKLGEILSDPRRFDNMTALLFMRSAKLIKPALDYLGYLARPATIEHNPASLETTLPLTLLLDESKRDAMKGYQVQHSPSQSPTDHWYF